MEHLGRQLWVHRVDCDIAADAGDAVAAERDRRANERDDFALPWAHDVVRRDHLVATHQGRDLEEAAEAMDEVIAEWQPSP